MDREVNGISAHNGNVLKSNTIMTSTPPSDVLPNGMQWWRIDGRLHREGDKPAAVGIDGFQAWLFDGQFHRAADKPAIISQDGSMEWYVNGTRCRSMGKPALVMTSGISRWYTPSGDIAHDRRVTNFEDTSMRFAFVLQTYVQQTCD